MSTFEKVMAVEEFAEKIWEGLAARFHLSRSESKAMIYYFHDLFNTNPNLLDVVKADLEEIELASLVPEPNTNNDLKTLQGDGHGDSGDGGKDNTSIDEPSVDGLPNVGKDGTSDETSGSEKENL